MKDSHNWNDWITGGLSYATNKILNLAANGFKIGDDDIDWDEVYRNKLRVQERNFWPGGARRLGEYIPEDGLPVGAIGAPPPSNSSTALQTWTARAVRIGRSLSRVLTGTQTQQKRRSARVLRRKLLYCQKRIRLFRRRRRSKSRRFKRRRRF